MALRMEELVVSFFLFRRRFYITRATQRTMIVVHVDTRDSPEFPSAKENLIKMVKGNSFAKAV